MAGLDIPQLRFGTAAVVKEFINMDQLVEAINVQLVEDVEGKPHRLIGEILVDLGHINHPQVDEALAEMGVQSHPK